MPSVKKGVYESPQSAGDGLSTGEFGGKAPGAKEIIKSANARGGKRHDMKGDDLADVNVLPRSGGASLDKDGIYDDGYLTKKGLTYGPNAFYNTLPPGMDIDDQENIDSRSMDMHTYEGGLSYPDDGSFPSRRSSGLK
jgi:hypothetical protein